MENTRFLNRIEDFFKGKIQNNPGSDESEFLEKSVDYIANSMKPHVDQFNVVLLGESRNKLQDMLDKSRSVRDTLNKGLEIKGPMREFQKALNNEFCIDYWVSSWCVSASDVLNASGWIFDKLMDPVLKLAEPQFEAIGLPKELPDILGLYKLDELENHINALEETTQGTIGYLLSDSMNKMTGYDDVLAKQKLQLSVLERDALGTNCADIDPYCYRYLAG